MRDSQARRVQVRNINPFFGIAVPKPHLPEIGWLEVKRKKKKNAHFIRIRAIICKIQGLSGHIKIVIV